MVLRSHCMGILVKFLKKKNIKDEKKLLDEKFSIFRVN